MTDADIKSEVAAFAAQLGLRSGGDGGFDDSDFRPEKASVKLGHTAARSNTVRASDPAGDKSGAHKNNGAAYPGRKADGDVSADAVKSSTHAAKRTWNDGVGERPGAKTGRSLLGSNESAVWHEAAESLAPLDSRGAAPAEDSVVEVKTRVAEKLMEAEVNAFQRKMAKASPADAAWLKTVKTSGTMRDKIAAAALLVQESAVANMAALDDVMAIAAKPSGGRQAAGHALAALVELFRDVLLPNRKLTAFHARPLAAIRPSKEGDKRLLYWWCEDCVKQRYALFLDLLRKASLTDLEWMKEKALRAAFDLLTARPEQEGRLLTIVVNKLGDPSRRVASKAGYLISCLLTAHPLMTRVVVREVETFLFRPGQKARAQYYAIVTLNQMVLSHNTKVGGPDLAAKLIDIYFAVFRLVLDEQIGTAAQRRVAAEAAAKAQSDGANRRGGPSHLKGNPARKGTTRAASTAQGSAPAGPGAEEVDARILGALLTGVRRAFPYVEHGRLDSVFERHAQQLFRTVHLAPFNVSTQALMLLFQVMDSANAVSDRFYNALYAVLLHRSLSHSSALSMFLGLTFQAIKGDVSDRRAAAFVKRLLQVACVQRANVACGIIVVVSEALKARPVLWSAISQAEDAGVEAVHDAPDASDGDEEGQVPSRSGTAGHRGAKGEPQSSAQGAPLPRSAADVRERTWPADGAYDMQKRAPQHAGAMAACWWELAVLCDHVHPSVATMARTLLAGTNVLYDGDPLQDLTLLAFLDKFVKRKPGKGMDRGASVMQPVRGSAVAGPSMVGAAAFEALAAGDVNPEEAFFHKFFTMQSVRKRRAANRAKRKGKRARGAAADGGLEEDGEDSGGEEEGSSGGEDGSDAEDAFLDAEEILEDDALGDPRIGADLDDLDASDEVAATDAEDGPAPKRSDADTCGAESVELVREGDLAGALDDAIAEAELDGVNLDGLPSASGSDVSSLDESDDASSDTDVDAGLKDVGSRLPSTAHLRDSLSPASDSDIDEAAFHRAIRGHAADGDADVALAAAGSRSKQEAALKSGELHTSEHVARALLKEAAGADGNRRNSKQAARGERGIAGNSHAGARDKEGADRQRKRRSATPFAAYDDYADVIDKLTQAQDGQKDRQGRGRTAMPAPSIWRKPKRVRG